MRCSAPTSTLCCISHNHVALQFAVALLLVSVYHSKVLSGAKKERNQYSWTTVFLDNGIANRTIGRAYALIFRNQNPAYTIKKRKGLGETLIYWPSCTAGDGLLAAVSGFGFDVAACAPPCLRHAEAVNTNLVYKQKGCNKE